MEDFFLCPRSAATEYLSTRSSKQTNSPPQITKYFPQQKNCNSNTPLVGGCSHMWRSKRRSNTHLCRRSRSRRLGRVRCRSEPSSWGRTALWRPRQPPWTSSPLPSAPRVSRHCADLQGTETWRRGKWWGHPGGFKSSSWPTDGQSANLGGAAAPVCGRPSWSRPPWRSCPPPGPCSSLSSCSSSAPAEPSSAVACGLTA